MSGLLEYLLSSTDPDSVKGSLAGIVLVCTIFIIVFGAGAVLTVGLEWLWS